MFFKWFWLGTFFKQGLGLFFVDIIFEGTLNGILFDIFVG